jgi:hypothetical protein
MTELSPNAQAIFNAVWNESTYDPGGWEISCQIQIAAALRAAVDRLSYGHGSWSGPSAIIDADELIAIANELSPPCKEHD